MTKEQAIELFEQAKGETKRNQKINAMKQSFGWLVLREYIQHNVTDKLKAEVVEVWTKGILIERNRIIKKF